MTKQIRIENADTSDHKVAVEVWQKSGSDAPDTLVKTLPLDYGTAMVSETIWKERYLVVKEV